MRGTSNISQVWPTPPFCPFADCPRNPGGPSVFEFSHCHPTENCIWQKLPNTSGPSAVLWRTVRSVIFAVDNFSAEPLVDKSNERRTVRPLPADCPQHQISDSPEFCQLSQFQLQFGIIAHIKIQKSQILHENLQKTHMSKLPQEFKNKSSKIMKTHKWLKNTSKIQKKRNKECMKEPYATCASFQATFEKSMIFNSFLNLKNRDSSKGLVNISAN